MHGTFGPANFELEKLKATPNRLCVSLRILQILLGLPSKTLQEGHTPTLCCCTVPLLPFSVACRSLRQQEGVRNGSRSL